MRVCPHTSWLIQLLCESTIARMGEEDDTKRRHHSPEQIVRKSQGTYQLLGEGTPRTEVCNCLEVTQATDHRYPSHYGGGPDGLVHAAEEFFSHR